MSLLLIELAASANEPNVDDLARRAREVLEREGARLVETSHAEALGRLYVVAEGEALDALPAAFERAELRVLESAPVRLIGTPAEQGGVQPSHSVEWDFPKGLGMDTYLKRKAEKTPLYAQVPEVKFLRTYVREDMIKCVCLYDAPDEEAVRRARAVVSAPVDRLSRLGHDRDGD